VVASLPLHRRVLMVHALSGMRGPGRTLAILAPEVSKTWDVCVAAPKGSLVASLQSFPRVDVRLLPLRSSRYASWALGSERIYKLLANDESIQLVHANGLSALNLVAPAALRFRKPILVHFHGSDAGARARSLARLWVNLRIRMLICSVSEQSREVLLRAGLGERLGPTLPNPVSPSSRDARASLDGVRVGFVGSASPRKGLHILVDIASRLADEDVSWRLFGIDVRARSPYVLDCKRRLELAGLGPDRVMWGGVIADPEDAYRQIDILVVPSTKESWSRVAMEGMAAGVPLVGTAIPGMSEVLSLVPNALTFPVDRPDVGAEHVRTLLHRPKLRRSLGASGRESMRQFDVRLVCRQLTCLYERMLDGDPALA
jgi:glycosyltransferase involved in cell wall biosynthesis